MARHAVVSTPAEIDRAIEAGRHYQKSEVLAVDVEYDPSPGHDYLTLRLSNGQRHLIPREDIQGMQRATPKMIKDVRILGGGTAIHWPRLDLDLYVPALLSGKYGNLQWMQELGRKGGLARTEEKRKAARANGAKGGRPRKTVAVGVRSPKRPTASAPTP